MVWLKTPCYVRQQMKHHAALDQLAHETRIARARLGRERLLRAALWFGIAVLAWAALAMSGAHGLLPPLLQSLTAIAALVGLAWLALRAKRAWRAPTLEEAR